jgi:hypothetical protein
MGLSVVEARHVRVTCDACRTASAEICGRRELAISVRASAVPRFEKAGWHFDVASSASDGGGGRLREWERARREGMGRWYCPTCASKGHL